MIENKVSTSALYHCWCSNVVPPAWHCPRSNYCWYSSSEYLQLIFLVNIENKTRLLCGVLTTTPLSLCQSPAADLHTPITDSQDCNCFSIPLLPEYPEVITMGSDTVEIRNQFALSLTLHWIRHFLVTCIVVMLLYYNRTVNINGSAGQGVCTFLIIEYY